VLHVCPSQALKLMLSALVSTPSSVVGAALLQVRS
jgi:hypothetical protein